MLPRLGRQPGMTSKQEVVDYSRQLHCFAAPSNGSQWPHSEVIQKEKKS